MLTVTVVFWIAQMYRRIHIQISMDINKNFALLDEQYLFSKVGQKVEEYIKNNPNAKLYRLGIGDVSLPIAPCVKFALQKASIEMSYKDSVKGYGEYAGLESLRAEIAKDYDTFCKNTRIGADEVFVTDGAKNVFCHIMDIFDFDTVLVPDPVYPVYRDSSLLKGKKVLYAQATTDNDYLPKPNENIRVDIIYLCSPNNPTGGVYCLKELQQWVDYALDMGAILFFDAAYKDYIVDSRLPKSIYCCRNATQCAIEICSFSKNAGFTGLRCGYVIVPNALQLNGKSVKNAWYRFLSTNTNGVSYPIQCAALATLTQDGRAYSQQCIDIYMKNAQWMVTALTNAKKIFSGGSNAPYVWLQVPTRFGELSKRNTRQGDLGFEYFDYLLNTFGVITTPGIGFGDLGKDYVRLSAFGDIESTKKSMEYIGKD